jgi:hypothetical protein
VLRETTSRGMCGLGCPSRTSERGGEGDCLKEGGGGEGKCERERALPLYYDTFFFKAGTARGRARTNRGRARTIR